jgi:hypothetical protein
VKFCGFSGAPSFAPALLLQRKLKKRAKGGVFFFCVVIPPALRNEGNSVAPDCWAAAQNKTARTAMRDLLFAF